MRKMLKGEMYSDDELEAFGVRRITTSSGSTFYEVPCAVCGRATRRYTFSPSKIVKCVICASEIEQKRRDKCKAVKRQHEEEMAEEMGVDAVHYRRFEKGVSKFGLAYYPSIEQAETVMSKFESVPEVVACIEMLYIGARVIPHQSVGSYTVDFCLPDEKVIVEIDGSIYHANADKEFRRDLALKNMLGSDWIIRHIPSDAVMKNHAAFGKGLKKLLDDRRFELNIK